MDLPLPPSTGTRLGFHYFPNTFHYRESDLHAWLPELKALGASWLTLVAPLDRAVPEPFLAGLLNAGIEPILFFPLPFEFPSQVEGLQLLFNAYASWGVRYTVLFDRPNTRQSWPANSWAQADLVERFLDLFLPVAEEATQSGLIPVFPPLEPGGDYWDTAFLRAALQGIQRRGHTNLLQSMVLGAYAKVEDCPLNWGAGGPERWPGARPYFTPPGQQDQRGFYIFDWYLTLAKAVLGKSLPMLLFGAGSRLKHGSDPASFEQASIAHARENLHLARLAVGDHSRPSSTKLGVPSPARPASLDPIPSEILGLNFWLLVAGLDSPHASQAWFQNGGEPLPIVSALKEQLSHRAAGISPLTEESLMSSSVKGFPVPGEDPSIGPDSRLISHYLLLPTYEWGVAEWHLEAIRPFVKRHRPTIGFSLEEAAHAAQVTVVGGEQSFPAQALDRLVSSGCRVERIAGDGTSIASQLATR